MATADPVYLDKVFTGGAALHTNPSFKLESCSSKSGKMGSGEIPIGRLLARPGRPAHPICSGHKASTRSRIVTSVLYGYHNLSECLLVASPPCALAQLLAPLWHAALHARHGVTLPLPKQSQCSCWCIADDFTCVDSVGTLARSPQRTSMAPWVSCNTCRLQLQTSKCVSGWSVGESCCWSTPSDRGPCWVDLMRGSRMPSALRLR